MCIQTYTIIVPVLSYFTCDVLRRNDAIKHVRDAAELALTRMGGEEAAGAIKVTQVLTGEMQALRSQGKG